ncbi:MAG: GNAT family N-acetyltransferase [Emcibacter sp.]|nr:GNAT family N-acetyltransferase [Emcibacter sp.]
MSDDQIKDDTFGQQAPRLEVDLVESLSNVDLMQLCDVTREAISVGESFNWLSAPEEKALENYWKGVILMRERTLFLPKMDGQISGSCQLLRPPASNEVGAFRGEIVNFFLAPWARNYGLAKEMISRVQDYAIIHGCRSLEISVRSDQRAAISICEWFGMEKWGTKKRFAYVNNQFLEGYYYAKDLD